MTKEYRGILSFIIPRRGKDGVVNAELGPMGTWDLMSKSINVTRLGAVYRIINALNIWKRESEYSMPRSEISILFQQKTTTFYAKGGITPEIAISW